MNQKSGAARRSSGQGFTEKQGQYLAFIYAYSRMFRRPPAEADMQRHFRVSPPSVHQMVLTIERAGFIRRQPGVARSIELLVAQKRRASAVFSGTTFVRISSASHAVQCIAGTPLLSAHLLSRV